jgi:hypothetical protein
MSAKINTANLLWVIGVLQPVTASEIRMYLTTVLDDAGTIPSDRDIHKFCLAQTAQQHLVRVLREPDLFSLTRLGNGYLSEPRRKSRDKARIYLLREAYKSRLTMSCEVDATELDGAAPSSDARPIEKGNEANKFGPVVPSGQTYWPRFSRQLLEQTGPSETSRDSFLPLLSFATNDQIAVACRSRDESGSINSLVLGLMLGISPKLIQQISRNTDRHYRSFELAKRGGGVRPIESPRVFLKVIQRFLLDYLLYVLPVSENVFSFRSGISIADNANNHVAKDYVANIDIENFFGSITKDQVFGLLRANDFDVQAAGLISDLVTKGNVLPQGAASSPTISNSLLFEFDRRMSGLSEKSGLNYSRYADDISISGSNKGAIENAVEVARVELLRDYGLRLNAKKTRISSKRGQQKVTGLVVNEKVWPPRQFRRKVRAAFHNAEHRREVSEEQVKKLSGYLSYLKTFDAMSGSDDLDRYQGIINALRPTHTG